jgi:hypothetical protein
VAPGGRLVVRVGDFADNADLPLVVRGDRPIVVERGMYRLDDVGITMSMGIPLDQDVVVPDPLDG